jgi:MoxR-like ATPase
LSQKTTLLSGDIGSGKTFIIESLAEIVGIKLNVIQFNTEITSSDLIGRLEMCVDSKTTEKY